MSKDWDVDSANDLEGARLRIVESGTDACSGVATLVAGTKVINTSKVTANSRIQLTAQALGTVTVAKPLAVTARTAGTSFTITSADNTDTSIVAWLIVEPAVDDDTP
jgi:hypothetical protein